MGTYKKLQKKLTHKFETNKDGDFKLIESVHNWLMINGIKPKHFKESVRIISTINGSVPYVHQFADRAFILSYLLKNNYKDFKNDCNFNIRK